MKHEVWCNCHDLEVDLVEDCTCAAYQDPNRLLDEVLNHRAEIEQQERKEIE